MEATPLIWYFLTLGAVWNIDRSYFSGTDTKLSQAVCGDECDFPFDSRPALSAVHVLVWVFKARDSQEHGHLSRKALDARVVWRMHDKPPCCRATYLQGIECCGGGLLTAESVTETGVALFTIAHS
jgi:hypothetical protein